jgi:dUTPase
MRIAQLVIVPVNLSEPREVTELPESQRGEQGFGSSAH